MGWKMEKEKLRKNNLIAKLITKEYLKQEISGSLKSYNKVLSDKIYNLSKIYGENIKYEINTIYEDIYNIVLKEVEEVVDFTMKYSLDFNK